MSVKIFNALDHVKEHVNRIKNFTFQLYITLLPRKSVKRFRQIQRKILFRESVDRLTEQTSKSLFCSNIRALLAVTTERAQLIMSSDKTDFQLINFKRG